MNRPISLAGKIQAYLIPMPGQISAYLLQVIFEGKPTQSMLKQPNQEEINAYVLSTAKIDTVNA